MAKHARFILEVDEDLKDAFFAAVQADNRPASDVIREFMDNYVRSHTESENYVAFLEAKVSAARKSLSEGKGQSNAEVEAEFAAKRAAIANNDA